MGYTLPSLSDLSYECVDSCPGVSLSIKAFELPFIGHTSIQQHQESIITPQNYFLKHLSVTHCTSQLPSLKMVYPTNAKIKALLESQFESKIKKSNLHDDSESLFQFGHLDELFSEDVEVHISGHEFHLNGKHRGLDAFKEHLESDDMPSLNTIIDVTKPIKGQVLHVIGGDNDEWKAAVLHSTATTKNSELLLHISSTMQHAL